MTQDVIEEGKKRWEVIAAVFDPQAHIQGIEVGVWFGRCSKRLLRMLPNLKLYSVDSWKADVDKETMDGFSRDMDPAWWKKNADEVYLAAKRRLAVMGERSTIIRADAEDAVQRFDDESMDFVFLDGDHRMEPTLQHCRLYWPKVKPGGWLFGHDYGHPCAHWGVKEAVSTFAKEIGERVQLSDDLVWAIQKGTVT